MTNEEINRELCDLLPIGWEDFCTDFNAIIRAERVAWSKDWNLRDPYEDALWKMFRVTILDADPKERAEALLETIKRFGTK